MNWQKKHFFWLAVCLFFYNNIWAQVTLDCNESRTITALTSSDLIIPQTSTLTISMRGGDGGDVDFRGSCNRLVKGGAAASAQATFKVSNTGEGLRPGGTLRVFVGQHGEDREPLCSNAGGVSGAGGGASAVLYLPPGDDPNEIDWYILTIAGGGGGAARPAAGAFHTGKGGRSDKNGGSSGSNAGGYNATCPEGKGPGGGISCESWEGGNTYGKSMAINSLGDRTKISIHGNGRASITGGLATGIRGGDGFSGGGSTVQGGGGGGGFFGGASSSGWGGGGGGSYARNDAFGATNASTTAGGNGEGSSRNGFVAISTNGSTGEAICKPGVVVALDENGTGQVQISDVDNGSLLSTCSPGGRLALRSGSTLLSDPFPVNCSTQKSIPVQLLVFDAQDNIADQCASTISIVDNIPPVLACRDITVELDESGYGDFSYGRILSGLSDNCDEVDFINGGEVVDCHDLGASYLEIFGVDLSGNVGSCEGKVTVVDRMAPQAICKDIAVQLDETGNASISAGDLNGGSTDNCSIAGISASQTTFDCSNLGENTLTFTVTDESNNAGSCTATVTVVDDIPPVLACRDITVELDESGYGDFSYGRILSGLSDNCDEVEFINGSEEVDCHDLGASYLEIFGVDLSGNVGSCEGKVTVVDRMAPQAICKDIAVQLDETGNASISAGDLNGGSTDNCSIAGISASQTTFDCSNLGENTVTLTVTDESNNAGNCTATVTVVDDIPPVLACRDITVELDESGYGDFSYGGILSGLSDNCVEVEFINGSEEVDCHELGASYIEIFGVDLSGNVGSCEGKVTVVDRIAPQAICRDVVVQLDESGNGSVTAAAINNGSSDACGIASMNLDKSSFTCAEAGSHTVALTVTDDSNNAASCTSTITVESVVAESIHWELAPGAKLWPPDYSYTTFSVSDMVNGISDVCGEDVSLDGVRIDRAYSDEAEDEPGSQDGYTLNDIVIAPDCRSVQVRREKMGGGNGRVYTVTLAIQDALGSTSYADYNIQVPKWAWGWGSDALEDSERYSVSCVSGSNAAALSPQTRDHSAYLATGRFEAFKASLSVFPNPFREQTTLVLDVPKTARATVEIFDLQGRQIRQLFSGELEAGRRSLQWDGTDAKGAPAPSGLYLIQLRIGERLLNKKVLLQRG